MKRILRAIGLVALVATQACWLQSGSGAQRRGFTDFETEVTSGNVGDLTVAWTAMVGGAPREALIDGHRALVRTPGGLRALDVRTGAILWTAGGDGTLAGNRLPAVIGDTLYVPDVSTACWLTQVDTGTGAVIDRQQLSSGSAVPTPPALSACPAGDALAVGSTAIMHWSYISAYPEPMCSGTGVLSIGTFGVTAVDVDGGPNGWNVETSDGEVTCGFAPDHIDGNQASSGEPGSILITEGNSVRQVSCTGEGCPGEWTTPKPPVANGGWADEAPVVLVNGDVAAATYWGAVVVFDGTTHAVDWTGVVGSSIGHGRPVAADRDTIFVTTADSRLLAFPVEGCGAATCPPSWTATLPGPAGSRPAIGGDVVYVGGEDGTLSAFAADGCGAATCPPLWTATTPGDIVGAPSIAGGRILVGSVDGTVTAFALPDVEG